MLIRHRLLLFSLILGWVTTGVHASDAIWRSTLYPEDWDPQQIAQLSFETDKLIQDFSYAGYKLGEKPLPRIEGPIFNVTDHGADATGSLCSTQAIQSAIDAAAKAGGGVVLLPEGTFLIDAAGQGPLRITTSHIVLRGQGPGRTFLLNTATDMRSQSIISVTGPASARWFNDDAPAAAITADLMGPTTVVPVADTSLFQVGSQVVLRSDATRDWILEHKEDDWLNHQDRLSGVAFHRQVTHVSPQTQQIHIDVPIRYYLKTRDKARVSVAQDMIHHVGLEDFSIGNVEIRDGQGGFGMNEYRNPDSRAGRAHGSRAIMLTRARDSWVSRVHSYHPPGNETGAHLLSNGIVVSACKALTISDCHFQRPQYGGGGGNGYMFRLSNTNEVLVERSIAQFSRHGLVVSGMACSGNVFHQCIDRDTALMTADSGRERTSGRNSDHHMHFSQSNLIDNCLAENSAFEAVYRPFGTPPRHNLTAAHSVFWNTRGEGSGNAVVLTAQSRYGYAIGTRGTVTAVRTHSRAPHKTDPEDHVEGVGQGDSLQPQSLLLDQRRRRGIDW